MFAAVSAATASARPARAQDRPPTGSGTAGGALLGAELVLVSEAVSGVRPVWAYALGGVGGAAAGGVGGYFVEARAEPDASLYLFAAGFGLLIPTVVWLGDAGTPRVDQRPVVSLRFGVPAPYVEAHENAFVRPRLSLVPPERMLSVPLVSGTF
jgi:hypothetical protein